MRALNFDVSGVTRGGCAESMQRVLRKLNGVAASLLWLLDLTAAPLQKDPVLGGYADRATDLDEWRWTIQAAIDEGVPVPVPVLSAARIARFTSRGNGEFSNRALSAMREEFGGHAERPATVVVSPVDLVPSRVR